MMCCSQGLQLWRCRSCLWEAVGAGFERDFGTFTLNSLFSRFRFPEGVACRQLPCCDAPACPMAELPGRPAGAWRSPVGSWVSVKLRPRCGKRCLPASLAVFRHSGSCDKPGDVGCFRRPLLVHLAMLSWLHVRWKKVCWVVMDACVFYFWCAWETVSSGEVVMCWMDGKDIEAELIGFGGVC